MPMPAPKDDRSPDKKPDTAGHRERLRQRFLDAGPGALADYEMLELLLLQCLYGPNCPVSTNENSDLRYIQAGQIAVGVTNGVTNCQYFEERRLKPECTA